mmetsp:Transcript_2495/g.4611  ORF Transcript_2495/g.4611 Transcript_2495/m.4611 type:complete len:248 (-) Transcript_2495:1385-2128(-)
MYLRMLSRVMMSTRSWLYILQTSGDGTEKGLGLLRWKLIDTSSFSKLFSCLPARLSGTAICSLLSMTPGLLFGMMFLAMTTSGIGASLISRSSSISWKTSSSALLAALEELRPGELNLFILLPVGTFLDDDDDVSGPAGGRRLLGMLLRLSVMMLVLELLSASTAGERMRRPFFSLRERLSILILLFSLRACTTVNAILSSCEWVRFCSRSSWSLLWLSYSMSYSLAIIGCFLRFGSLPLRIRSSAL